MKINYAEKGSDDLSSIYLIQPNAKAGDFSLSKAEAAYLKKCLENKESLIYINSYVRHNFFVVNDDKKSTYPPCEKMRRQGAKLLTKINEHKIKSIQLCDSTGKTEMFCALVEGLVLASYEFGKYVSKKESGIELGELILTGPSIQKKYAEYLRTITQAVFKARDLINEPLNALNAEGLAAEIHRLGNLTSVTVKTLNKKEIIKHKMGGLLAVNLGSVDPPTFTIMEYKPRRVVNDAPLVLVGKGIVYDTGGLSLKPTPDSMDAMKSDMSGAAAVACAIWAIAKAKIPVHVIGLIPATDNRPGGNAYAPGDIITMMDGTKVEMLNADAEGRMILADAMTYAKRYDPMLVIDIATLTGAASAAVGRNVTVGFEKDCREWYNLLQDSGNRVFERIVEFPLWADYGEMIKSKIADIKNTGGKHAGAITDAKFLEHFSAYPWIHLDIAGPAFLAASDSYRVAGGTGVGVRLLFDFVRNLAIKG
jgi:leucyl aminopeptidase